jgi:hypothetical protein
MNEAAARLASAREEALVRVKTLAKERLTPLYACGPYHPWASPASFSEEILPEVGLPPSSALLTLKRLRCVPGGYTSGMPLVRHYADLLASALIRLAGKHGLPSAVVCAVPSSRRGGAERGLDRVVEEACAAAGSRFRPLGLLLRTASLEPAHFGRTLRSPEDQIFTLAPALELEPGADWVVLVDDVVSSGTTLRGACALMESYFGVRTLGLALGATPDRGERLSAEIV